MNKKGNRTTTGYIPWMEFQRLIEQTKDQRIKLLSAVSTYCGLRISDVLPLTWKQLSGESIVLREKKTGKERVIAINPSLRKIIDSCDKRGTYAFASRSGKPVTTSYVNKKLKKVFDELEIDYDGNVSSHMFRKTLGRRYLNQSEDKTKALIMLMDVFNHSSLAVTKKYIGIKQEEINQVYLDL